MRTSVETILGWLVLLLLAAATSVAANDEEAFFKAIRNQDVATVNEMLTKEPDLIRSRLRDTSPVMAALFIIKDGFLPPASNPTLAAILEHDPPLDIFEASGAGDLARVRQLIREDRSRATAWNAVGWTPLHIAAFGGHVDIVKLLLDNGAATQIEARAKTRFRNTPLQTALLTAQYGTSKLLLERGADPLVRQSLGFTPMHEAAFAGRPDLVDLLLEYGAELNSRSDDGRTPLSEAMRAKREETVAHLKAKGAVDKMADVAAPPD